MFSSRKKNYNMDIQDLATDESAELNGKWVPFGPTAKLCVARAGNQNYLRTLGRLLDEAGIDLSKNDPDTEARADGVLVTALATAVLVGWEGLSFKGVPMEYSVANAKTLLGVREFRRRVEAIASDFNTFRLKAEAAQGNG